MDIMIIPPDTEQEKRLIAVLAQTVLEAGEEAEDETSRRVLPRIDLVE